MKVTQKFAENYVWLLGPLAVCASTILLVLHATGRPASSAGIVLFVAGVVATYILDHWLDAPARWSRRQLAGAMTPVVLAGLFAALWLPMWKIGLAGLLGFVGIFYRELKKWPLGKTWLVAVSWAAAGACFPVAWDARDLLFAPLAGVLLVFFAAGALLCDFKDSAADARRGVPTAVVLWGPQTAAFVAGGLAVASMFAALLLGRRGLAVAALALAILAAQPKLLARPVLGPALVDGALTLPALLILSGLA